MNRRPLVTVHLIVFLAFPCDESWSFTTPKNRLSDYGATRSVPHGRPKC